MDQVNVSDNEYMQRALRLAKRGLYTTDPNPRVGCVLVRDGEVVGEGWHRETGEPHAEILALKQAAERAKGSTVYVTLEPCSHTGKTPPCVDALIQAGVARVVAAMVDPNPLVAGKGLDKLRDNGVDVGSGLLESQARLMNPGFIKRMEQGLPYVRLKMAMSMDGRTAMESGESKWITGEEARRDVQFLRARSSAILTGIGTILADDPSMNVRLSRDDLNIEGEIRQPLRVVLDSQLRIPSDAKIFGVSGDVLVITTSDVRSSSLKCEVKKVPATNSMIDLNSVMKMLAERQINEVHVEAGAKLGGALIKHKLVDELVIYMAPHLMGDEARGLFSLTGVSEMKDRVSLDIQDIRMIGKDLRITARPV